MDRHDCGIARACVDLRKDWRSRDDLDPTSYVASWSERDVLEGGPCDAFVLILRTKGCRWARDSGCTFCGYLTDAIDAGIGQVQLEGQLASALERYKGEPMFKIYTSGSFLDDEEVPEGFQRKVLEELPDKGVRSLLVETLPSFATDEKLGWTFDHFKGDAGIELALGLESATPEVRKGPVNKPGKVEDLMGTSDRIRGMGGRVRTYIVIKPPLLSEQEALEDAVASAEAVKDRTDTISFNPINVQRGTIVERLFRRREYQPPWLWTVIEVLRRTSGLGPRVMSGPSGGGTKRGAHNCGRCDREILEAIGGFSISGDVELLEGPVCDCKDLWLDQLALEDHVHGPYHFDRRTGVRLRKRR